MEAPQPNQSKVATLFVEFSKDFFMSGDNITGNVLVNILQPINADKLILRISGKELVEWVEIKNKSKNILHPNGKTTYTCEILPVKRGDKNRFYDKVITLLNSNSTFQKAQYCIPFCIVTHCKFPSTVCIVKPEPNLSALPEKPILTKCIVEYTACVKFVGVEPVIKHKAHFIMRQQFSPICTKEVKDRKSEDITQLFCISRDGGMLEVYVENDHYDLKNELKVAIRAEKNSSKVDAVGIKASILQTVKVSNIPHTFEVEFTEVIGSTNKQMLLKGGINMEKPEYFTIKVDRNPYKYKHCQYLEEDMQFPSCDGNIVSISYYIKIIELCKCCFIVCKPMSFPIAYNAPVIQRSLFEMPSDWKPHLEKEVKIGLDNGMIIKNLPTKVKK